MEQGLFFAKERAKKAFRVDEEERTKKKDNSPFYTTTAATLLHPLLFGKYHRRIFFEDLLPFRIRGKSHLRLLLLASRSRFIGRRFPCWNNSTGRYLLLVLTNESSQSL